MGFRSLTYIGMLVTVLSAQQVWAQVTVNVVSAQGQTATKQAKITIGLQNANGDVLAAADWLKTLVIDGNNVAVGGLALTGGNQAMGIITWPTGGPLPGNHTVNITVKLKSGGTASMPAVATISFAG